MNDIIRIKIDVTKILKEHLFTGKTGAKYLDAALIPSKDSKFGDSHFIVQDIGAENRKAGKKGPIIGNAKPANGGAAKPAPAPAPTETLSEEVPF